jgi:hypothetical protein
MELQEFEKRAKTIVEVELKKNNGEKNTRQGRQEASKFTTSVYNVIHSSNIKHLGSSFTFYSR